MMMTIWFFSAVCVIYGPIAENTQRSFTLQVMKMHVTVKNWQVRINRIIDTNSNISQKPITGIAKDQECVLYIKQARDHLPILNVLYFNPVYVSLHKTHSQQVFEHKKKKWFSSLWKLLINLLRKLIVFPWLIQMCISINGQPRCAMCIL